MDVPESSSSSTPSYHQARAIAAVVLAILSGAFDLLVRLARSLWAVPWRWALSQLVHVVALPLRLVVWLPLSYVARFLLVLFAPALYAVSYASSCVRAAIAFVVSLEPLYTFFGAAAGLGIVTGIVLAVTSSIITSHLGMHDEELDAHEASLDKPEKFKPGRRDITAAVPETDWYWTESSPSGRRRPSGLLSQTIHEEDDDSDL
ncbi:hypothetical protein JDV02_005308 [Purpureocillium takamizusanense]|uniref:Uncharacterized protein n=1 Tax=Purpureocillium takamizusanense TaxID=2060973 RepID=A0A9Q8QH09_9HYPO|nr:uncharacterized protein JDV02_005308 [Purpureocillium takamizusanense]UNI19092.1 hypothetical protein JDV02_005308 [Purpureocillium takamizusanense]